MSDTLTLGGRNCSVLKKTGAGGCGHRINFGELMIKLYGPYRRKDGRSYVMHYDTDTKNLTTQSYPRYMMEQHLGRKLMPEEHVDHKNNDHTDDRIENFQLLTPGDNSRKARALKPKEMVTLICTYCEASFEKEARYVRSKNKNGITRFFCNRTCLTLWKKGKISRNLAHES